MFPDFNLDGPSPPSERPVPPELQSQIEEMLRRRLEPEERNRVELLLLQRLKERKPELTGMLQQIRFFTGFREHEDPRFGVAGQKARQRLDCASLKHRFPIAATRQAAPHGSRCPEAKAPVKPDALHTLARATNRLASRPARAYPFTPEFLERPFFRSGFRRTSKAMLIALQIHPLN